ncbi:MAG: hypothetical protein AB8G99_15465 [Planctomycetaceae bacterium]
MALTKREKIGLWIGVLTAVVPGLITSGFFPDFNVLPWPAWLAIAGIGGLIAGLVASPRPIWGATSGLAIGMGLMLGIWAYVALRLAVIGGEELFRFEIAIGAIIGAAPGLFVYGRNARS